MAYGFALNKGYHGIITMDGNGKDSIDSIKNFIAKLNQGYDYVQASRFIKGGKSVNLPLSRWFSIRFIHAPILSLAAFHWYSDTTQGFRAYSARYLLDPRVKPFRKIFKKYELLAYLTVRATQLNFKVCEVATTRIYPKKESVPTKIHGFSSHFDLIITLMRTLFRSYHPK